MRRVSLWALALLVPFAAPLACSDDGGATTPTEDAGVDAQAPADGGVDGQAPGDSAAPTDGGAADATADAGPLPFLDSADFAAEVKLAAAFPFGVVHRYTVGVRATGSSWGRHGGPMISDSYAVAGSPTAKRGVARVTLPATGTTAAYTVSTLTEPSDLPGTRFAGLGLVDLPTAPLTLDSYSTSGAGFPGEVLGYDANLARVSARASANGYFDGVGVATAGGDSVVYSGLSALGAPSSAAAENALWVSKLCNGALAPSGACAASRKLLTWAGSSGPVAADADGNVFVAASFYGKTPSDVVFGVPRAALDTPAPTGVASGAGLTNSNGNGVQRLAAAKPAGAATGWVVVKLPEYEGKTSAYAQAYATGTLAATGAKVEDAITYGSAADAFNVFTDAAGNLWIGVDVGTKGVLLELRPKP